MAEAGHPHGIMEGSGAYNRYAKPQAQGIGAALALLEQVVRDTAIDHGDEPVVIADYGSSQGKNSLAPVRLAIRTLRARLGASRPVVVYHVDQAANDFNELFKVLDCDPDRYTLEEPSVFPCAIGRSFYGKVLPPESVHIGWSSYAVVWLSRIPTLIPGHIFSLRGTGAVRAEFDRQGAQDWEAFLSLRATELRPGGRLMVVHPAHLEVATAGKLPGFLDLMDQANIVLEQMVTQGSISAGARARMVLGSYPRSRRELVAPFDSNGKFRQLTLEHCESFVPADAAWDDYLRDGDREALATRHAQFFRSTFGPSLASALTAGGDQSSPHDFADELEAKLKQRLTNRPTPLDLLAEVIVVAKQ